MECLDIAIPILPSRSIQATEAFYRALGFEGEAHEHSADYAIFRRGPIELHFFRHATLDPATSSAGCYLRVSEVADWYQAFSAAGLPRQGIPRIERLEDKPWGLREFALIDADGNLLRIGQPLD